METFDTVVALIGLFCFPITMVIRGFRASRSVLVYALLVATIVSIVWSYLDSRPSSNIRYGGLSYAAVLALSTYLYFTPRPDVARTSSTSEHAVGNFMKENARYLIIGAAIVLFGLIYACSHRYRAISDKSHERIVILDSWTGEVKTKF
jgi:hypothetical protein